MSVVFRDSGNNITKFNPYHDSRGRFCTAGNATSFTIRTRSGLAQGAADKAIEREKKLNSREEKHIVHGVDISSKLPKPPSGAYFDGSKEVPKLKGTEKQVKWANNIRSEIGDDVLQTYYEKYVSKNKAGFEAMMTSKKAMADNISSNRLIQSAAMGGNQKLIEEKVANAVSHFKQMADSLDKINNLLDKDDSRFWIDNRNNGAKIKREIFGRE